jgi:hypothetical protein
VGKVFLRAVDSRSVARCVDLPMKLGQGSESIDAVLTATTLFGINPDLDGPCRVLTCLAELSIAEEPCHRGSVVCDLLLSCRSLSFLFRVDNGFLCALLMRLVPARRRLIRALRLWLRLFLSLFCYNLSLDDCRLVRGASSCFWLASLCSMSFILSDSVSRFSTTSTLVFC